MKSYFFLIVIALTGLNLSATPLDTIPKRKELKTSEELSKLKAKYNQYYLPQRTTKQQDDDYLWSGEPINHDDLNIKIHTNQEQSLTYKEYLVQQWQEEGLSESEIEKRLSFQEIAGDDLKLNIEESLNLSLTSYGNSPVKMDNNEWQEQLAIDDAEEAEVVPEINLTDLQAKGIKINAFVEESTPDLSPAFHEIDQQDLNQYSTIRLTNISFSPNTADLKSRSLTELDQLANSLQKNRKVNFEIAAHLNGWVDEGTAGLLSEERAHIIKDYLIKKGVSKTRMTTKGYGKKEPLASNETLAGRRLNQRVEIRFRSY